MEQLAIFGAGGMGREVAQWALDCSFEDITFIVEDAYYAETEIDGFTVLPFSAVNAEKYVWLIAVGDSDLREKIINKFDETVRFATLIHPSSIIGRKVHIEEGVVICPNSSITTGVKIGRHTIVNLHTVIGHDTEIEEFVTISPSVSIMGNCRIGKHVFLGANSCIRENIKIPSRTVIGMCCVVVKNLTKGVYIGNPAKPIK